MSESQRENPMSSSSDKKDMLAFERWMQDFNKHYESDSEKAMRFNVFKQNLRRTKDQTLSPSRLYKLGLNEFSDLTSEEFRRVYIGGNDNLNKSSKSDKEKIVDSVDETPPDEIDSPERRGIGCITAAVGKDTKEDVTVPLEPESKPENE